MNMNSLFRFRIGQKSVALLVDGDQAMPQQLGPVIDYFIGDLKMHVPIRNAYFRDTTSSSGSKWSEAFRRNDIKQGIIVRQYGDKIKELVDKKLSIDAIRYSLNDGHSIAIVSRDKGFASVFELLKDCDDKNHYVISDNRYEDFWKDQGAVFIDDRLGVKGGNVVDLNWEFGLDSTTTREELKVSDSESDFRTNLSRFPFSFYDPRGGQDPVDLNNFAHEFRKVNKQDMNYQSGGSPSSSTSASSSTTANGGSTSSSRRKSSGSNSSSKSGRKTRSPSFEFNSPIRNYLRREKEKSRPLVKYIVDKNIKTCDVETLCSNDRKLWEKRELECNSPRGNRQQLMKEARFLETYPGHPTWDHSTWRHPLSSEKKRTGKQRGSSVNSKNSIHEKLSTIGSTIIDILKRSMSEIRRPKEKKPKISLAVRQVSSGDGVQYHYLREEKLREEKRSVEETKREGKGKRPTTIVSRLWGGKDLSDREDGEMISSNKNGEVATLKNFKTTIPDAPMSEMPKKTTKKKKNKTNPGNPLIGDDVSIDPKAIEIQKKLQNLQKPSPIVKRKQIFQKYASEWDMVVSKQPMNATPNSKLVNAWQSLHPTKSK